MTSFGLSPLGTELGPAGGPGLITVKGVLPNTQNSCVVVWDREPKSLDDQNPQSGVNHNNYTMTALDPTITADNGDLFIPKGKKVPTIFPNIVNAEVDEDDPKQIILFSDLDLEPGVDYQISVNTTIKSKEEDVFAGPTKFTFRGRGLPRVPTPIEIFEEKLRDFDYKMVPDPNKPNDATQVYRFDDSGDIALQSNALSLRKRIFRRILTKRGEFAFFAGYGTDIKIKALAKAGGLQEMANTVVQEVRKEPDVLNASAVANLRVNETGSFVLLEVTVQSIDQREQKFLYNVPSTGGT